MFEFSEKQLRTCFINCSKGEAKRMNLPDGWQSMNAENLIFFSWIDPKTPAKGYAIVPEENGSLRGVFLQKAKAKGKAAQMCSFCMTLHPGSGISLWSAPKAGEAGRRDNTLGTYLCSDLDCTAYIMGKKKPEGIRQMDETLTFEQRKTRTLDNARAFVAKIQQTP